MKKTFMFYRCLLPRRFSLVWNTFVFLGSLGIVWGVSAQVLEKGSSLEEPGGRASGQVRPVPFAGYEERLRQSPRWQSMTPEEQAQALEKLEQARTRFLDRQQQLNEQYETQIKKIQKPRESLMSKRRKREQYRDADMLWSQLQALPLDKRLMIERQLGLGKIASSQKRQIFQKRLDRLSFSKRNQVVRQIQASQR